MGIETIAQPINAENLEQHRELLDIQLARLGLEYVNRLISKKIPTLETSYTDYDEEGKKVEKKVDIEDVGFLIGRYTSILRDLISCRMSGDNLEGMRDRENWENIENEFKNKILGFYNTNPENWVEESINLLKEEKDKEIKRKLNVSAHEHNDITHDGLTFDENSGESGIIKFHVGEDVISYLENTSFSLKEGEELMAIHLDPLFEKDYGNKNKSLFSRESMQNLALKIVEKFPQTKAIMGRSWLIDTIIADKIGFKVYRKEKYDNSPSFWGQFTNQEGQLDIERAKKFIETGEAPYQIATGAIMTEDFLKKFLPKENKGKIILKELNPSFDSPKFQTEMNKLRYLYRKWDASTTEEVRDAFSQSIYVSELLDQSGIGENLFKKYLELKGEGKSQIEIEKDKEIMNYSRRFKEYIKSVKFKNKEVNIE